MLQPEGGETIHILVILHINRMKLKTDLVGFFMETFGSYIYFFLLSFVFIDYAVSN